MSRLEGLRPEELSDEQRELYESIAGGDRARDASFRLTEEDGSLVGPFNTLLLSPVVGDAVQSVGAAIRFGCGLSSVVREIAILSVAAHRRSPFEWWAHEPIGRRAGLDDAQIAALKRRRDGLEFDDDSRRGDLRLLPGADRRGPPRRCHASRQPARPSALTASWSS